MNLHNILIQMAFLYAPFMHYPTEEITPWFYRGPDPKAKDIYALHEKGIKTIISLRTNPENKKARLCEKLGMHWINIKTGVFKTPTPDQFDAFRAVLNNPNNRPIYTSCEIDMDRTGVYIEAWRRVDQHWTAQQMEDEFRLHHRKDWWPVFRKYAQVVNAYADSHQADVAKNMQSTPNTKADPELTAAVESSSTNP